MLLWSWKNLGFDSFFMIALYNLPIPLFDTCLLALFLSYMPEKMWYTNCFLFSVKWLLMFRTMISYPLASMLESVESVSRAKVGSFFLREKEWRNHYFTGQSECLLPFNSVTPKRLNTSIPRLYLLVWMKPILVSQYLIICTCRCSTALVL